MAIKILHSSVFYMKVLYMNRGNTEGKQEGVLGFTNRQGLVDYSQKVQQITDYSLSKHTLSECNCARWLSQLWLLWLLPVSTCKEFLSSSSSSSSHTFPSFPPLTLPSRLRGDVLNLVTEWIPFLRQKTGEIFPEDTETAGNHRWVFG